MLENFSWSLTSWVKQVVLAFFWIQGLANQAKQQRNVHWFHAAHPTLMNVYRIHNPHDLEQRCSIGIKADRDNSSWRMICGSQKRSSNVPASCKTGNRDFQPLRVLWWSAKSVLVSFVERSPSGLIWSFGLELMSSTSCGRSIKITPILAKISRSVVKLKSMLQWQDAMTMQKGSCVTSAILQRNHFDN